MIGYIWSHAPPWYSSPYILCLGAHAPKQKSYLALLKAGFFSDFRELMPDRETVTLGLRRFFHVSPYLSLCKACDPRVGAIFWHQGYN